MKKYIAICVAVMLLCTAFGSVAVLANTTDVADATTTVADTAVGTATTDAVVTTTTVTITEAVDLSTTDEQATVTTSATTTEVVPAGKPNEKTALETKLMILEKDGKIAARLATAAGVPVAGVPVSVQIGSTKMPAVTTDAQGYAVFSYAFPQDNTYIYCYTALTLVGNTSYKAAAAAVGKQGGNDTTTSQTEGTTDGAATTAATTLATTVSTQQATTVKKTQDAEKLTVYTATGTTGKEGTHVLLDFSFDSGVLNAFKMEQNAFTKAAKLLLTPDCYTKMMAETNGALTMSVSTLDITVTDEQIAAAMAEDVVLSSDDAADVERIVLDLSLQRYNTQTAVFSDVSNVAQGDYVIQLPIPQSMRSAQTIAVAAATVDGISKPVYAHISKDGFFRFETTTPVGAIVVLGMKGSVPGAWTGHAVGWAITLFVIGLLCIVGAVLLYVRYVRRPKAKKSEAAADESEQIDVAAMPMMEMPFEQPDVFDMDMDAPTPLQERKTPDIDIPL